ncbi:MAG: ABC transporter permease [Pirellulales bacterium]|nr:ABC transporter permease [Pirellulales bacterium]
MASVPPASVPTLPQPASGLAVWALASREVLRFLRQRSRVIGALGQPVVFWVLFGAGLGPSFRLPGAATGQVAYAEYFFPGVLVLILLFTSIFATISIIEDRREGFLQGVLVAPLSAWTMVAGKGLGAMLLAVGQALVFLALGLALPLSWGVWQLVQLVLFLGLLSLALVGLGMLLAWRLDSVQGFHAIMNLLLFPMWLLSGAFFPAGDNWLAWVVHVNPLTYGLAGVRRLLYVHQPDAAVLHGLPSLGTCWLVTAAFALLTLAASTWAAARRGRGDLR